MKKRVIFIVILFIFILLIVNNYIEKNIVKYPHDFNFIYRYGIYGKGLIDTYNEILKYDSVNGIIELKFELSIEEKNKIYSKMTQLNFMQIPARFPRPLNLYIEPISKYELIAEYQNEKNDVRWSTLNLYNSSHEYLSEGFEAQKAINEIGELIEQIINERLKDMDLPDKQIYL